MPATLIIALLAAAPFLGRYWGEADFVAAAVPVVPVFALLLLLVPTARRLPFVIVIVAALCATAGLVWTEWPPARPAKLAKPAKPWGITVVTHNVWVDNVAPGATVAALAASGADVILLQETNGTVWPYLERLRAKYPYASACRNRCSLAIFSRYPVDRPRFRFRDADGLPYGPPLVQTIVHPGGGHPDFRIVSVHLDRSLPGVMRTGERRQLARAVLQAADARAGAGDTVVAGDFNLVPWSTGMRDLDHDMRPLVRVTHALPSYPARLGERRVPFALAPIDHVFAGPRWRVRSARTLGATGSDHLPVMVGLDWQPD